MTALSIHEPLPARSLGDRLLLWGLAAITAVGLIVMYYGGLLHLVDEWGSDQYSHGSLIPVVSLAIVWLKRSELRAVPLRGSWLGIVVLSASLLLALIGKLATIQLLVHVSLVFSIVGATLAFIGTRGTRVLWFPLLYLFFMIPLPDFVLVMLSGELQLLSSALGVFFIRLFDISVFLDGNIIDLGDFKMQVVDACSGLRYMFPLMSFGFLLGYLYNGPFWQRLVVFLSTIPIAILMNSARIGVIGVLHEFYGIDAAAGFLHDFEGWAVFLTCLLILLLELRLLSYLNPEKRRFLDYFSATRPRAATSRTQTV